MRRAALLLLAAATALPAAEDPASSYEALLARLRARDASVDFRALREAHAASADYAPNQGVALDDRRAVEEMLEAGRFADAAARLEVWLARDPLNPFAHMGAARAYRELGDAPRGEFHAAVVDGLYGAICAPGEGDAARPCRVLSIDEEHFYLGMRGLRLDGHWGTECEGGQPCQVYAVTDPQTRRRSTIFFDISLPYAYQQTHEAPLPQAPAQ